MTNSNLFENEHEGSSWGAAGSLDRIADALEAIQARVTQETRSRDKINLPPLDPTEPGGIDEWERYILAVVPDAEAATILGHQFRSMVWGAGIQERAIKRRPWTRDQVRNAVNSACECGGNGPGSCCAACEVWHGLNGASE